MPSIGATCVRIFFEKPTTSPRSAAFERILHEALQFYQLELFSYQLMSNHYHLVLRPLIDGEMSRFMGWIGGTHTMRYHAHYHTSGLDHVYQQRYKSFPIQDDDHFWVVCRYVERNALRAKLVARAEDWRWGSLWRWQQAPEPDPNSCLHGPFRGCRIGYTGLTLRSLRTNWTPFACPLNAADLWEIQRGGNPSPDDSSWNPRSVHEGDNECQHQMTTRSKRPDPFKSSEFF